MEDVYGRVSTLSASEAKSWTPPPAASGHLGRYLWTDAFGVLNFITLSRLTQSDSYLLCAARLINAVHSILGRTRSQDKYLPRASPERPLSGGLRIGKDSDTGPDRDGQYHHYLTLWMFALNRMSAASGDKKYNSLAIELAKAIHPAFVVDRNSSRPHMRWKMSEDLSEPLVSSEGNLDPVDGYFVFSLLQKTSGDASVLKAEIEDYKKIVGTKWKHMESDDPLDLGMTLWSMHWLAQEESWASTVLERATNDLRELAFINRYFENPLQDRLAFREFGTCMGIKCAQSVTAEFDEDLDALANDIVDRWEESGVGPKKGDEHANDELQRQGLRPITKVMYAAALIPGAFCRKFL